ncbi:MAG: signal peptidase I [Clostridia bacterium]|nr:signal peptidase I [Clostridia bacterium]
MKSSREIPSVDAMKSELDRIRYRKRYATVIKHTVYALVAVAAAAVLVATLWLPVLRIQGGSMNPTLFDKDIVVSAKSGDCARGDVIAFYYNNKILVKRVIALPGDWIDIDGDGFVYVNNVRLDEPYVSERALGDCDIELPYQIPAAKYFVMGDHRSTSVDSRNTALGCVSEEQIVGRILFRVWPTKSIGSID